MKQEKIKYRSPSPAGWPGWSGFFLLLVLAGHAHGQSLSEEINHAINRGLHSLLLKQEQDGSFRITYSKEQGLNPRYPMGVTALAMYALLKSGMPPDDPCIRRAYHHLRYMPFKKIYSVSTLIMAVDALHDPTLDPWIQKAAAWIEDNFDTEYNLWSYPGSIPEMSNTQFAVLALWVAERHGYEVRKRTWTSLLQKVISLQNEYGGYGYRAGHMPESSGSMTTAGITVLTLALDRLKGQSGTLVQRGQKALDRAWGYLDTCFTAMGNPAGRGGMIRDFYHENYRHYYYLYGIERIAALSNRTAIGGRRWYLEGALHLLRREKDSGGWGSLINTSFALLFLRRATLTGLSGKAVSAGIPRAARWRFTCTAPSDGWADPGFDDSGWSESTGAFGTFGTPGGVIRTIWDKGDIWIRRAFNWREDSPDAFRLFVIHDDAAEIYINGVKAAGLLEWQAHYVEAEITDEARAALKKGVNVLAAHCNNIAGKQILDVRLSDIGELARRAREEKEGKTHGRWWKMTPREEVPFIQRWLVLGPVDNRDGTMMLRSLLPDEEAAPSANDRSLNTTWRPVRSHESVLDFEDSGRLRDRSIYYAYTSLLVRDDSEALLWLGADDGIRVFLDGKILLSHHSRKQTVPDWFVFPLRLRTGTHRLLIKIYNHQGAAKLHARISGMDGTMHEGIRPVLSPEEPDWSQAALAQPGLFTMEELLEILPLDKRSKLGFDTVLDLERIAMKHCQSGTPRWLERSKTSDSMYEPNPGGKGILALWPLSKDAPACVIRKILIPKGRDTFQVKTSAECKAAPGKSCFTMRLGVFDGTLKWIAEAKVTSDPKPSKKQWRLVKGSVAEYEGKEVLLLVECGTDGDAPDSGCAFIDEASLK